MGLASHDEAMDALRAENDELEAAVDALTEAFVLQRERIAHLRSDEQDGPLVTPGGLPVR